jgi:hypothetical protein
MGVYAPYPEYPDPEAHGPGPASSEVPWGVAGDTCTRTSDFEGADFEDRA